MKRKWFLQPGRVPHLLTILSIFPEREEFYAFWVEQFPKLKVKFQVFFTDIKENIWRLLHFKTIESASDEEFLYFWARVFTAQKFRREVPEVSTTTDQERKRRRSLSEDIDEWLWPDG